EPRIVSTLSRQDGEAPQIRVLAHVDVTEVDGRGRTSPVMAPVLVAAGHDWASLPWRSEIEFSGRLRPAEKGDDVSAAVTARGVVRVLAPPGPGLRAAETVRDGFRQATAHLPADARGLVPALVIGDTRQTPPDLTQAMLDTGMSHLSAVSGSNVTLVLAAAMGLCRLALVPRRHRPWVALMVLIGFVVLARPEPSVIRAGVMGAVGLLGLSTRRRQAGIPALAGAVLALLAWDPWLSRSYGFALSSVATLGLLVLAQPWGAAIRRRLPPWLGWLGPVIAVPVAAQAVCAPVVVPLQSSVSVIAVPANLLAAPLVAPTTMAGVAVALTSVVSVGAASLLAWLAALPAMGIAWVARACAEAPYGSVAWDGSAWGALLLGVLTILAIGLAPWLWRQSHLRPLITIALVLFAITWATPTSTVGWPPPGWLVIACDVGQGDGLVVNNGSGHAIVVDTGPDPDLMDGCLRRLGVEVVDLVVLTHFHADHTDGLAGVLDRREVAEIRVSPVREPPGEAADVDRLATEAGVPVADLRGGDVISVGGVRADVWWPSRTLGAGSVANNGSVVMTLRLAGVSILFAGDMEREAAAEVVRVARREPVRWGSVDVLKVPHHGSANRDDRILDHIAGRVAIVSVGADNDYGHPAPSALTGLRRKGFHVYRTDLEGDVALVRTAEGVQVLGRGSGS
ncbi:MAG TPA: ComEC/Rec2 family competence protein, partial [Dermatophilaceae bacterium]|nr:ComEC/Rec2 family competence protein [Dermatophilaceae bacterium]